MAETLASRAKALDIKGAVIAADGIFETLELRPRQPGIIVVGAEALRATRKSHGWNDVTTPTGERQITKDGLTLATKWNGYDAATLQERGATVDDVKYAGLPDVYEWAQANSPETASAIQARVYDHLLPYELLAGELTFLESVLGPEISNNAAVRLAANGLHIVRTLFGDPRDTDGRVRSYQGTVQTGPVLAAYHHLLHTTDGIERLPRHFAKVNEQRRQLGKAALGIEDLYAMVAAFAYHDSIMGDGRKADNEYHYDELQAAELAAKHALAIGGYDGDLDKKVYAGIMASAFNEKTKGQSINSELGFMDIQIGVAGTDLGQFTERRGVLNAFQITVENMFKTTMERKIDEVENAASIHSIGEALRAIEQSPSLKENLASGIEGSASFCRKHAYPEGWTLDNATDRDATADAMVKTAQRIRSGENISRIYADLVANR